MDRLAKVVDRSQLAPKRRWEAMFDRERARQEVVAAEEGAIADEEVGEPPEESKVEDENFVVKAVLGHRRQMVDGNWEDQYLLRWKGYGPQHDSWEPAVAMECDELVSEFWERQNVRASRSRAVRL